MTKTLAIVAGVLLSQLPLIGGIAKHDGSSKTPNELPPNNIGKLQIDTFKFLTDKNGVFLPEQFFEAPIGSKVKIFRTDGFCYEGTITQIDKSPEMYKIIGVFENCDDSGFGIAVTNMGQVAGTVLERKNDTSYMLEYSQSHKGWVFMKHIPKKPIQL